MGRAKVRRSHMSRSITRVPANGCSEVDLAMFEDPAIALQWLLRGVPSLRASAVARDGKYLPIRRPRFAGTAVAETPMASRSCQLRMFCTYGPFRCLRSASTLVMVMPSAQALEISR